MRNADKDRKLPGLVLRRTNYGEADRILNLITPVGKISAMAKGVRRPKSKMAGGVEIFTLSEYNVHFGKDDFGVVTGVKMVKHFGGIIKDYGKM
ncbi:DNA repair protein RecO, partial [Candidatus Saccharibacteria bacterium]|nr:DNA repair protein RecO [Candidatus Saccharibacteria bacterium]